MKINYLPNLEPGSKLDLGKRDFDKIKLNPEKALNICRQLLKHRVDDYNKMIGRVWLNEDGAVKLFAHPDRPFDEKMINAQEAQWAKEKGKTVEAWRADKEKDPANLTEMALTLMLQKILPDRFLVVRAASYDDYNNFVDQLILDRESGDVICGIDEVVERDAYKGPNKKEAKIRHQMEKGGFKVKYGVKFEKGELKEQSLKNIPAFYLSISKDSLAKLVANLEQEKVSLEEKEIFTFLRQSLLSQLDSYKDINLNLAMRENINRFKLFLEAWPQV